MQQAQKQPSSSLPAPRGETAVFWGLFAVMMLLRVLNCFNYRFDSDEAQHLHVVWGWGNGLLQYRDFFDNHAPLFHILLAPVLRVFGERPDILLPMRLVMIPFFLGSLWLTYRIGVRLGSKRIGMWAVLFAAAWPVYFNTSTEFRADDLWMILWIASIYVFTGGAPSLGRMAVFGFLLGATFAVSMKTSLLLATFSGAGMVVIGFNWIWNARVSWTTILSRALVVLLCASILPGLLVAYYLKQGAVWPMYYCVIAHNVVPGLKRWKFIWIHTGIFAVLIPCLIALAAKVFRSASPSQRNGQALVLLSTAFFIVTLYCFWPDITREDFLPFVPLAALVLAPIGLLLGDKLQEKMPTMSTAVSLSVLVCLEFGLIIKGHKPWHSYNSEEIAEFTEILQLTRPGDYVMDAKDGGIYRQRPYYFVIETLTRARMKVGQVKDTVPEDLVSTKTHVVHLTGLTDKGRGFAFIQQNYLPLIRGGDVCVPGKMFHSQGDGKQEFEIAIPGRYELLAESGTLTAAIDGHPVEGPVFLNAGHHTLETGGKSTTPFCLFWDEAVAKGYSPFRKAVSI